MLFKALRPKSAKTYVLWAKSLQVFSLFLFLILSFSHHLALELTFHENISELIF
jgi:hypothetical protein